jgi:hypothetical protein
MKGKLVEHRECCFRLPLPLHVDSKGGRKTCGYLLLSETETLTLKVAESETFELHE